MTWNSTGDVLGAVAAVIEGLTPYSVCGEDDKFRIQIGVTPKITGFRVGLLEASGGIHKPISGRTAKDWETTLTLNMYYADINTELGQDTVLQQALRDSEDILQALYDWTFVTDGIHKIEPDLATVASDGDGELIVTRLIRVEFKRG